jgi:uncharacterized Zn finger protein
MAARAFSGFRFAGTVYGGPNAQPIIKKFKAKDSEQLTKGDVLNLESGEVDLAATNDSAFIGVSNQTVLATDSTTDVEVIVNHDAVWAVYDANARAVGANLDITGATGAMGVTTDSNSDVEVVWASGADEPTYVRFVRAETALGSA